MSPGASPSVQSDTTVPSCLEAFRADELEAVLARCDSAVNAKPEEPAARSDRALVLNLLGRTSQACENVAQALKLQQEQRAEVEPMLRHELNVRQAACRQERTMAGKD